MQKRPCGFNLEINLQALFCVGLCSFVDEESSLKQVMNFHNMSMKKRNITFIYAPGYSDLFSICSVLHPAVKSPASSFFYNINCVYKSIRKEFKCVFYNVFAYICRNFCKGTFDFSVQVTLIIH